MIPTWKKILSYLFPIHLDECVSDYSGTLEVKLSKGEVQLLTDHAIYSHGLKYYNYVESFKKLKIQNRNIKKVLILGYGFGSVAKILHQYDKSIEIVGVEIDPQILHLNESYGYNNSNTILIEENALEFIQSHSEQYDLIALDIFIDDIVPSSFEEANQLTNIKNLMAKNGLLLYNRLAYTEELRQDTDETIGTMNQIFDEVLVLPIQGNKMIVVQN
jgi:spermidine synthase